MTRTYIAINNHKRFLRKVIIKETYPNSQHWTIEIYPEGYGSNPKPIMFCTFDSELGSMQITKQEEGYGIFRPEYAEFLAEILTGNKIYLENK